MVSTSTSPSLASVAVSKLFLKSTTPTVVPKGLFRLTAMSLRPTPIPLEPASTVPPRALRPTQLSVPTFAE